MTFSEWYHLKKKYAKAYVWQKWKDLEQKDHVPSNIMCQGLEISFIKGMDPTLSSTLTKEQIVEGKQAERLTPFVEDWLENDMVGELVGPDIPPSWFSRLFTVPKDKSKWRPIIDLSKLNK